MQIKRFYHYGGTKKEAMDKASVFLDKILKEVSVKQIGAYCVLDRCEPEDILIDYKYRVYTEIEI